MWKPTIFVLSTDGSTLSVRTLEINCQIFHCSTLSLLFIRFCETKKVFPFIFSFVVHDQAADRAYRLGQKKDVYVNFFDCGLSIDEVMSVLNKYKSQNAKVILPDGTDLGTNAGGGISYQEISGLLSRAINGIVTAREDHIEENGPGKLIPCASGHLIDSILQDTLVHGRTAAEHEAAKQRWLHAEQQSIESTKLENPG